MNNDIKSPKIPTLVSGFLTDAESKTDNLIADVWNHAKLSQLIKKSGFKKRSGLPIEQVLYLLIIWVWLKADSIAMFSKTMMESFGAKNKDVLYDQLKREDLNWRKLHYQVVKKTLVKTQSVKSQVKAYIVDDSVKVRKGNKLEGVSRHFDHLLGRTVKGQQVLTLGYAIDDEFFVLDNDIYMSQVQRHSLKQPFKDARSIVGKRYSETQSKTKPELLASMVKRAMNYQVEAEYLLADAWFGNKSTIALAHDVNSVPVLRMKNNKTKYRYYFNRQGKRIYKDMTASELHHLLVRKYWKGSSETPYQTVSVQVELNLASTKTEPDNWVKAQLLFVRGVAQQDEKPTVGKKDWALFLTTDCSLSAQALLELYSLRWGIEVYFKEAKQHLGWLTEQTETFAAHIASLHLCAIRYTLLIYAKIENGWRYSDARQNASEQLTLLSYAKQMWGVFRFIIQQSLNEIIDDLGVKTEKILATIDNNILRFFTQALQLDHHTLALET